MTNTIGYNAFKKALEENAASLIPKEEDVAGYEVKRIEKSSGSYDGLVIILKDDEKNSLSPIIRIETLYELSMTNPALIPALLKRAVDEAVKNRDIAKKADAIMGDYEMVKERLFAKFSASEESGEIRKNLPYRELLDMCITYHVEIFE